MTYTVIADEVAVPAQSVIQVPRLTVAQSQPGPCIFIYQVVCATYRLTGDRVAVTAVQPSND